jgi:hypothetical protein
VVGVLASVGVAEAQPQSMTKIRQETNRRVTIPLYIKAGHYTIIVIQILVISLFHR